MLVARHPKSREAGRRKATAGFTLIELLVVMAIFALMVGFASINLIRPQTQASLDTTVTTMLADVKEQQIRAMVGDGASSHGVQFNDNNYILFTGSIYPSPTDNFTINLDPNIQITPNPLAVVFAQRSGETGTSTTLTVTNTISNEQKTLTINSLGAVTIQ